MRICIVENCTEMATLRTDYCLFHGARKRNGIPLDIPKGKAHCAERNGRWNGGISQYPNHSLMKKMRKEILEEANYICYFCGEIADRIHHKDLSKTNHSKDNLVACCHKCHGLLHRGRKNKAPHIQYNKNIKLKQALQNTGRFQCFIAKQINITGSRLSDIVMQKIKPSETQKKALAKILKKSVRELFGETK